MIVLSPSQITRYFFHHLIQVGDVHSADGRTLPALTAEVCADYLAQHPHCIIGGTTYAMLKAFKNNSAQNFASLPGKSALLLPFV